MGYPTKINTDLIKKFIKEDLIPVITPMGIDEKEQMYNKLVLKLDN